MCGAAIPPWMDRMFEGLDDHPTGRQLVAATVAAEMCRKLYAGGVRSFHFYTLNRAGLSYAICDLMGLRTKPGVRVAAAERSIKTVMVTLFSNCLKLEERRVRNKGEKM